MTTIGLLLALSVSFADGKWNPADWIVVKSPRFDYCQGFEQRADCIANICPKDVSPEAIFKNYNAKVYSGMVWKDKFPLGTTVTSTMGWDWRMAPLIVLAPGLGKAADGKTPEFREHWEIVLYDQGINIWHHFMKPDGKPAWFKLASVMLAKEEWLAPNVKHKLSVYVHQDWRKHKNLVVSCGNHTLQCVDDSLPDSFYVGVLGCEGRNFFWDFEAK